MKKIIGLIALAALAGGCATTSGMNQSEKTWPDRIEEYSLSIDFKNFTAVAEFKGDKVDGNYRVDMETNPMADVMGLPVRMFDTCRLTVNDHKNNQKWEYIDIFCDGVANAYNENKIKKKWVANLEDSVGNVDSFEAENNYKDFYSKAKVPEMLKKLKD